MAAFTIDQLRAQVKQEYFEDAIFAKFFVRYFWTSARAMLENLYKGPQDDTGMTRAQIFSAVRLLDDWKAMMATKIASYRNPYATIEYRVIAEWHAQYIAEEWLEVYLEVAHEKNLRLKRVEHFEADKPAWPVTSPKPAPQASVSPVPVNRAAAPATTPTQLQPHKLYIVWNQWMV
jgi:hypothetical protein